MPIAQAQTFLKATSALIAAVGLVVALAAHPQTAGLAALLVDIIYWPYDGAPTLTSPATRLSSAIAGGVMVGWGAMLWLIATRLLPVEPVLAATIVRTGAIAWFTIDSLGSWLAGAPLNIALNLLFLAALLWPVSQLRPMQPSR